MCQPTNEYSGEVQVLVARNDFDLEDYQIDRKAGGRVTWKCPTCGGYHVIFGFDNVYLCTACSTLAGYLLDFESVPEGCKITTEVRYGIR